MKFDFLFQSSPWFIPLCLLVGGVYAFVLYQKNTHWTKSQNYLLAAFRFVSVSVLSLLLLSFLIRQITQVTQKKTVVFAIDNSSSLNIVGQKTLTELKNSLNDLKESLENKEYQVDFATFDEQKPQDLNSIQFNKATSNLSQLLSGIKNTFEDQNLTDVVLVSDGIFNEGISPASENFNFVVNTVGLGDTIPKKDVAIKTVYANKIAYLGNKFPVQADISAFGFSGKTANVYLKQAGKIIDKQVLSFQQNDDFKSITFNATASQIGVQHLTVEVDFLNGEFTNRNNRQDVYVEVIDGKEKILLLALAPHPDVKALKSIIEKNENYEVDVKILTENANPDVLSKNYNLLILHQLPDVEDTYENVYQPLIAKGIPTFLVLGNQSGVNQLNQWNQLVKINTDFGEIDKVTGVFNKNFKSLNFESNQLDIVSKFSPISVPFGEYTLLPNTEVVLYQKVGNTQTPNPLLAVGTGAKKSAIFMGEGLWNWRLEEYQLTEKQVVVDDIITKVLQYISAKDDKRKLRVYPVRNLLSVGEKVVFETEIYNAIYEKLYDIPIKLEIKDEKGITKTFTYSTSPENTKFEISTLPAGVYRYKAVATVLGKTEQATGEFVIRDLQIENANLTADFDELRQLSKKTGGTFYKHNQFETLKQAILNHQVPDKIEATEDLKEMINLRWIFFLILTLLTAEWVIRKYLGGY
ncbi:vWA domain-containing protein [Arcicella rigui]|uniref:VWA domain-containing protein n=1 Tax=Arcicella rigui TaxID=797020 RepID=A0ABU5QH18_9BACT|nr:VWA domain-containing protein [Arcicella rigui]MEA5141594.1 VWA domain-containing protein [Arcicella rigui]